MPNRQGQGRRTVTHIRQLNKAARRLEYVEQPCRTIDELAAVRRQVDVRSAADESIRRADDPLRVAVAGAADGAVIKCTPLVGMRRSMHYLVPVFTGLGAWLLLDEPIGQQRLPA